MGNKTIVDVDGKVVGHFTKGKKQGRYNPHGKWIWINILKENYEVLQEMADEEGRRMNIVDGREMLRSIVNQICIKYREAKTYEGTVENTFIDMFPTVKHYEELRSIITKNVQEYLKELKQEQKRRERI